MNTVFRLPPSGGTFRLPPSEGTIRISVVALLVLIAFAAAGQGQHPAGGGSADLEQARVYFEHADREGISDQERRQWLEKSMVAHPTYRAAYELGKLHRQAADHSRALARFHRALGLTDQDRYLARAAYQIAVTHEQMDHYVEARRWLRKSLSFDDHEAVRRTLRDLELNRKDRIASAAEILDELRIERSFGVAKAELRVHFELNQASLDDAGHRQAVELGKALSDRRLQSRGETFYLLGHTDRLCPSGRPDRLGCDRHNLDLSERRAATVRRVLTHRLGLAPERVRVVGCGRRHLLSDQDTADDHYLNRRVVVMVTEPPADGWDRLCGYDSGLL